MSKPYSVDLRERAVAAVESGLRHAEVVRLFNVSWASLKRWLFKRRSGQSLAPKTYRPGPCGAFSSPEALAALKAQLEADADGRLIDHCRWWQARTGQAVSVATVHRARRALGWTHKKKAHGQRTRRSRTGGLAGRTRRLKADRLGLCR
jgi:transposase